jgi:hypothetical protein
MASRPNSVPLSIFDRDLEKKGTTVARRSSCGNGNELNQPSSSHLTAAGSHGPLLVTDVDPGTRRSRPNRAPR